MGNCMSFEYAEPTSDIYNRPMVTQRKYFLYGSSSSSKLCDVKCPVCYKMLPSDDIECHLVMCLTKPRVKYNVDVLTEDKGECVICFEEMGEGETISRLPCLCIYHRHCIDKWFLINRSCPEHPSN